MEDLIICNDSTFTLESLKSPVAGALVLFIIDPRKSEIISSGHHACADAQAIADPAILAATRAIFHDIFRHQTKTPHLVVLREASKSVPRTGMSISEMAEIVTSHPDFIDRIHELTQKIFFVSLEPPIDLGDVAIPFSPAESTSAPRPPVVPMPKRRPLPQSQPTRLSKKSLNNIIPLKRRFH